MSYLKPFLYLTMDNYFKENIEWINQGSDRFLKDLNGNFTYISWSELANKYFRKRKGVARWAIQELEKQGKIEIKKYQQVNERERTTNGYRILGSIKPVEDNTRIVQYKGGWLTITKEHIRLFNECIHIIKCMGMEVTKKSVMEEFGEGDLFEYLWDKKQSKKR